MHFPLFLCLLLCATGCSSFNRQWRQAEKSEPIGIAGRWEGRWHSDANGHNDKLRCILTPISPNSYEAKFHAKYRKVLGFGYTATFVGTHSNGVFHFAGDADLGKLAGGVYTYSGRVDSTHFFSTYNSKYDHGTFRLTRPD